MNDLFEKVHQILQGIKWQQRSGDFHADCPFCGKEAKKGQTHFSYSEVGYKCFVCGENGGLVTLARHLRMEIPAQTRPYPVIKKTPKKAAEFPYRLVRQYASHPDKYKLWQAYKPLTNATIDRWQLGVGVLPYGDKAERLIIPVIRHDKLVMVRGRALANHPVKWQTCGSPPRLFGAQDIPLGSHIFILANMVDALLMRQLPGALFGIEGNLYAVAPTSGEMGWQAGWGNHLARLEPQTIMICLDNDTAGQQGAQKVLADCRTAGLAEKTALWTWPDGTPKKYDMGELIINAIKHRA